MLVAGVCVGGGGVWIGVVERYKKRGQAGVAWGSIRKGETDIRITEGVCVCVGGGGGG